MRRVGIIALVVLCAACSSSTKAAAPTTTSGPSVKQIASSVAQAREQFAQAETEYTNQYPCATAVLTAINNIAAASIEPPKDNSADLIECQDATAKLGTAGNALITAVGLSAPAELHTLATQTRTDAKSVVQEADTLSICLSATDDKDVQNCFPDSLTGDVETLKATLAGWDAYL